MKGGIKTQTDRIRNETVRDSNVFLSDCENSEYRKRELFSSTRGSKVLWTQLI